MKGWTALVPLRLNECSKSRLSGIHDGPARVALATDMARHVLDQIGLCAEVERTILLTSQAPEWWEGTWSRDNGRGLNTELSAWRREHPAVPVLIIHADLPLLQASDITALIKASGETGSAIAPDRSGTGTNALALRPGAVVTFCFGPMSRAGFARQRPGLAEVIRAGLSHDLDTPEDVNHLLKHGWRPFGCKGQGDRRTSQCSV